MALIVCGIIPLLISCVPLMIDVVVDSESIEAIAKIPIDIDPIATDIATDSILEDVRQISKNEFIVDTPTCVEKSFTVSGDEIWIHVDLNKQMLYVARGNKRIKEFIISSGVSRTPTLLGSYKIYAMYPIYTMQGKKESIPNVLWSMFYHCDYAIHGAYWHNNFGEKTSRGCINMKEEGAKWVYQRVKKGTHVYIYE